MNQFRIIEDTKLDYYPCFPPPQVNLHFSCFQLASVIFHSIASSCAASLLSCILFCWYDLFIIRFSCLQAREWLNWDRAFTTTYAYSYLCVINVIFMLNNCVVLWSATLPHVIRHCYASVRTLFIPSLCKCPQGLIQWVKTPRNPPYFSAKQTSGKCSLPTVSSVSWSPAGFPWLVHTASEHCRSFFAGQPLAPDMNSCITCNMLRY